MSYTPAPPKLCTQYYVFSMSKAVEVYTTSKRTFFLAVRERVLVCQGYKHTQGVDDLQTLKLLLQKYPYHIMLNRTQYPRFIEAQGFTKYWKKNEKNI